LLSIIRNSLTLTENCLSPTYGIELVRDA